MTPSATISIWQSANRVTDDATDRTMWQRMLHQCGDGLFLYARQLCHNDADAADVLQEAFLRVWRKHANNGVTEPDKQPDAGGVRSRPGSPYTSSRRCLNHP
jgi:hypothetical protein